MRKIRIITSLGAAFASMAMAGGATTAAQADNWWQPGCWSSSCTGQDPVWTGCDGDAITVDYAGDPSQGVWDELRYSPSCNAYWALNHYADAGYTAFADDGQWYGTAPGTYSAMVNAQNWTRLILRFQFCLDGSSCAQPSYWWSGWHRNGN